MTLTLIGQKRKGAGRPDGHGTIDWTRVEHTAIDCMDIVGAVVQMFDRIKKIHLLQQIIFVVNLSTTLPNV